MIHTENRSTNEWMKDTLTHILHKSISLKNITMTSNPISLDALVSRSKPELPVVSACSTLSLPLEVPGTGRLSLSGWLHARFPIPRSSTGSSAPTHGIPYTVLSTSISKGQLTNNKKSVVLCNLQEQPHKSIYYSSTPHFFMRGSTI